MSDGKRLLLIGATTGYQTGVFAEAAKRLGLQLKLATDRCHVLDDPWGEHPPAGEAPNDNLRRGRFVYPSRKF
jgi:hypothetical protein